MIDRNDHPQSGPLTVFKCATRRACVIHNNGPNTDSIVLGADGPGPSYLAFDGFEFAGFSGGYTCVDGDPARGCVTTDHITIEHSWAHGWNRGYGTSSPLIGCCFGYLTIRHDEIGPECCSGDGVEAGAVNHFTLADNYIHDLYDTCRTSATTRVPTMNRYGAQCRGTGFGDTTDGGCTAECSSVGGDHVDGIQLQGGKDMSITGNRFYNTGLQAIFMENAVIGKNAYDNVTITNNMIGPVCGGACGTEVAIGSSSPGGITGVFTFAFNTVEGEVVITNPDVSSMTSGSTLVLVGNIANSLGTSLGCDRQPGVKYVWNHNLVATPPCTSSDLHGKATFVDGDAKSPNLHLQPGSRGLGQGPTIVQPETDIDGHLRPIGWPSDIGASERETASIVPGRSIGYVHIGEGISDVLSFYGRPRRIVSAGGLKTAFFRVAGGSIGVAYDARGHVIGVGTTSKYYRLGQSVGVGSNIVKALWLNRLPIDTCSRSLKQHAKGNIVFYRLSADRRRLQSIVMIRPRYAQCAKSQGGGIPTPLP